jgi:hypothetical protein
MKLHKMGAGKFQGFCEKTKSKNGVRWKKATVV